MAQWEEGLALDLPATSREEVLYGLLVKDLLNGGSYDVEVEEPPLTFTVDYTCGDELEGDVYRLLIVAEVDGEEDHDILHQFTEEVLQELTEEARGLMDEVEPLGAQGADNVEFRRVEEDDERWDLVVPDWLAPDGAEVPFGFRSYLKKGGEAWPEDAALDVHGRVLVVPYDGRLHLFGTPMPPEVEDDED